MFYGRLATREEVAPGTGAIFPPALSPAGRRGCPTFPGAEGRAAAEPPRGTADRGGAWLPLGAVAA